MSLQTIDSPEAQLAERPARPRYQPLVREPEEFRYRPTPALAVVGLTLALLSSIAVFVWMALPLCVVAMFVSGLALLAIRRSRGAFAGTGVALTGMFLSAAFLLGGIGYQVYAYKTEVPEGYERVSFIQDISKKGLVEREGFSYPHPDVEALSGKKIFLKGFIYQTGQLEDLGAFLLVKDNQDCCFGANPAIWDRVGVVLKGAKINYVAGKVAVAGTFRLNDSYDPQGSLDPIYILEADLFTSRVSDF